MCQARAVECNELKEPSTMEITTVGLDIAKRVFQLHGVDAAGKAVLRRKLQRSEVLAFFKALPPCLVGIEACGTAHYWAREIRELGHEVRLMPPSYVVPYVKRGKTDAADKEICNCDRAMAVIRCLAQNMWDEVHASQPSTTSRLSVHTSDLQSRSSRPVTRCDCRRMTRGLTSLPLCTPARYRDNAHIGLSLFQTAKPVLIFFGAARFRSFT